MLSPLFTIGGFRLAGPLYALALIATTVLIIVARHLDEAPILVTKPPLRRDEAACGPPWLRSNFAYGFLLFVYRNALAQTWVF
ncbi:hypothetical protein ACVWZK_008482 [Bradyrhizobium sp. GM0.4]